MSNNYVSKGSTSSGLAHLENEVLQDIQATFHISPTYGIPTEKLFEVRYQFESRNPQALFLRNVRTRGGRFLDAPQRIFVVDDLDWRANRHLTGHPGKRGCYNYALAVTLLHENGDNRNSWCRKTLIHEVLHSVSLYSRIWNRFPNIIRFHKFFREGITETLTGYILFKRHRDCYEGWKSGQLERCLISYRPNVRIWCSFCQCVGINDLAEFYLSSQENPTDAWNQLVQSIHALGFTTFNYQLDPRRAFNELEFRQVCIDSFPNFREIYESLTRCLDFSRIT